MATASFERFGRYELRGVLGEGAMGVVYRAFDPELTRDVAIKIIQGWHLDDEHLERFRREARALARLPHPHVVAVYDVGTTDTKPYIVMEFVDGRSLGAAIADGDDRPFEEKVRAIAQICDALSCAHAAGVIHRDVKPGNILLGAQGGAKLADFGIARFLETTVTAPSRIIGTPAYLAPEIFEGASADERSDVYGLAACLYEWLTGVRPHDAADVRALAAKVSGGHVAPLSDFWADCPLSLEQCVQRGLARDPARRFQTAQAFGSELRAILVDAAPARYLVQATPERRTGYARTLTFAVAAVGVAALLLALNMGVDGRAPASADAGPFPSDGTLTPPSTPAVQREGSGVPKPGGGAPSNRPALPVTSNGPPQEPAPVEDAEDEPVTPAVPVGAIMKVNVLTELRTDRSLAGHAFDASLSDPLVWNGIVFAEAGTPVKGLVDEVHPGGRNTPPFLRLSLTSIRLGGVAVPIRTARYHVVAPAEASRGSIPVLVLGVVAGALAGSVIAGTPGAVTGGALGTLLPIGGRTAQPVVLTAPLPFKLAAPLPHPFKTS